MNGEYRNLLLLPTGRESLFRNWPRPLGTTFDVALLYYDPPLETVPNWARQVWHGRGEKFALIAEFCKAAPNIHDYDAVFIPDDDLRISPEQVETIFHIFHFYRLAIAQPALDRKSFYSHKITRWCKRPEVLMRYTNFVEIMCPIFSRFSFRLLSDTFEKSPTGYGLDIVWAHRLAYHNLAVIDGVQINHGRPIQSHLKLKKKGIDPDRLIENVVADLGASRIQPAVQRYVLRRAQSAAV